MRGPKPRVLPVGNFVPWHNRRVPVAVLMIFAALLMLQIRAGVPLTMPMILTCALAVFAENNVEWKPKIGWARMFADRIGVCYRRGTRAARSLPSNFLEIQNLFITRITWIVHTHAIPPDLFLNADETGIRFLPVRETKWAGKGSKQVDVSGADDKRQFTATPVISASGCIAGRVQIVWQGKTSASCPTPTVQGMFSNISHVFSPTHWSTPNTVLALVESLHQDYVLPTMSRLGLDKDTQGWVLLWDVYSSHRDAAVLLTLKENYPTLIILFVPASTTSELQPLDKGFNHPWKTEITRRTSHWMQSQIQTLLKNCVSPEAISLPTTKSALVNPFCTWISDATEYVRGKGPDSISKVWRMCGFGDVWEKTTRHFELLAVAMKMNDDGSLWLPSKDAKRSKAGNLPRTQLVVAGLTHVPELNGVQYQAEDGANDSDMEETPAHVIMASEISEDPDTPPLYEVLDTLVRCHGCRSSPSVNAPECGTR